MMPKVPLNERCPAPASYKFSYRHVQGNGIFSDGCHFCGLYYNLLPPSAVLKAEAE